MLFPQLNTEQHGEPLLNEFDKQSALWKKLRKHVEERLAAMRARNDSNKDETETARLRGRIAECKRLLSLDKSTAEEDD